MARRTLGGIPPNPRLIGGITFLKLAQLEQIIKVQFGERILLIRSRHREKRIGRSTGRCRGGRCGITLSEVRRQNQEVAESDFAIAIEVRA